MTATVLSLVIWCAAIAPEDGPTLAWNKPEGANLFEQGQALFKEGKYAEANKVFKDARKLAKGRTTKQEVGRWREGSEGGFRLAEYRRVADNGNLRSAYAEAEKRYSAIYRHTPIAEAYEKFLAEMRDELFTSIETFDVPSKRFSEKFGKTFVNDPKFVKQGRHALKWETISHPATLKIKVPRNLTRYRAVSFWINFPKGGMNYKVVFKGSGKSAAGYGGGQLTDNTFAVDKRFKKGWHRVEIPLKDFTQYGKIKWTEIKEFLIYFEQKRKVTLYVDDIALVKK